MQSPGEQLYNAYATRRQLAKLGELPKWKSLTSQARVEMDILILFTWSPVMRFIINVCPIDEPKRFWDEVYIRNEVKSLQDAEAWAKATIDRFNDEERERYGSNARLRKLLTVRLDEANPVQQHTWAKVNLVTIMSNRGAHDKYRCEVCGCQGIRYGLAELCRTGKWKAKKYEMCIPTPK